PHSCPTRRSSDLSTFVMTVWTCTYYIAIRQKLVKLFVIILLRKLLDKLSLFVKVQEKLLRKLMMNFLRSTVVDIERDTKLLKAFLYLLVIFVNNLLRRDAFFLRTDSDSCTMFI